MQYLEIENRKLHYELSGQGEAIVLIHGIALDSRSWGGLPEFLSRNFTVATYDLRGHGIDACREQNEGHIPGSGVRLRTG